MATNVDTVEGSQMNRLDGLLLKAAQALENGADPFSHSFLVENKVTLDECMTLSERIAIICKGWLAAKKDDQIKLLALGAVYGEEGIDVDVFRSSIEHSQKTAEVLGKLKRMK